MSIVLSRFVDVTINARVNSSRIALASVELTHWHVLIMSLMSVSKFEMMAFEVVFHFYVLACFCLVLVSGVGQEMVF